MLPINELTHPLVQHHLARLRDVNTRPAEFRRLVGRLAILLGYEATKDFQLSPHVVQTPLAAVTAQTLRQRIGLVPILRAGLGMVDPLLQLLPDAEVWHLGVYRDETTKQPVEYYSRFEESPPVDAALVVDPMLATGGSAAAALRELQAWGVPSVKLLSIIAARPGVDRVREEFPHVQVFTCAVDAELNDKKFIVPGLGDAGDRTFGTPS